MNEQKKKNVGDKKWEWKKKKTSDIIKLPFHWLHCILL